MRHFILIPVETASSGGGCLGPLFVLLIIFIALTNNSQSQQGQVETREGSEQSQEQQSKGEYDSHRNKSQARSTGSGTIVLDEGSDISVEIPKDWDTLYVNVSYLGNNRNKNMNQIFKVNGEKLIVKESKCINLTHLLKQNPKTVEFQYIVPSKASVYSLIKDKGWVGTPITFAPKCLID